VKTPVDFHIPGGACDCHVHVFDPIRFPYASGRIYTPPDASLNDLCALQSALRLDRVVVVAPSVYGTDNSCTIDAVRQLGARARGVVVLDDSVTALQLDEMAEAGIHGARLNLETTQDTDAEAAKRALSMLAGKLSGRDWHVQFDTRLIVIAALMDEIRLFPLPIVFSHFGRARAALGPRPATRRTSPMSPPWPALSSMPTPTGCSGAATGRIRAARPPRRPLRRPIPTTTAAS
jgi:predicted TIM-barrel fold metal-dependent hydrolase